YRSFSYRPLGVLLLAQMLGQAVAAMLERRRSRLAVKEEAAAASVVAAIVAMASSDSDETANSALPISKGMDTTRQPLCHIC
ncbi:unnamed protein product, partial [Polarella glacialis]